MKAEENHHLYSAEEQRITDLVRKETLPGNFSLGGKIWVVTLLIIIACGIWAYSEQLSKGLVVTGMRDLVSWGMYISTFVFFVAVSLVGSLITAVLYLLKVKWRAPLTRIAEIIAVASILFAAIIIVVDMGRPDRMHHLFLHARLQSPIVWDVIVVTTYLVISILLLYIPLLPDIAYCRDNHLNIPKWQRRMYAILALNWKGNKEQKRISEKAVHLLSIMIIPVALGIHTVTSWLFATTLRPGWDSTNFGAYFVSGAFQVGAAVVIAGMFIISRSFSKYKKYITPKHFDHMGKLLVLLSLVYLYFNVNEFLVPAYKMKQLDADHLTELFIGAYAPLFWFVMIFGMAIPIIVLLFKKGRNPGPLFFMALLVIAGAWVKRFIIVIPTMQHPFLPVQEIPESYIHYSPTLEEWLITIATIAGALLIITLFVRFFPVIPADEVAEEKLEKKEEHADLAKEVPLNA